MKMKDKVDKKLTSGKSCQIVFLELFSCFWNSDKNVEIFGPITNFCWGSQFFQPLDLAL